jgi:hypothetical protein
VPASAVIPAPVAYTKVAAVKKLVVGFLVEFLWWGVGVCGWPCVSCCVVSPPPLHNALWGRPEAMDAILHWVVSVVLGRLQPPTSFTLNKLECFKQAACLL